MNFQQTSLPQLNLRFGAVYHLLSQDPGKIQTRVAQLDTSEAYMLSIFGEMPKGSSCCSANKAPKTYAWALTGPEAKDCFERIGVSLPTGTGNTAPVNKASVEAALDAWLDSVHGSREFTPLGLAAQGYVQMHNAAKRPVIYEDLDS
ncbi:MAG: hypothetical protein K2X01_06940 [Cyanobacteria bacterium]|nr:hypothetical protein [Cyanobacteriota bacterium]